MRGRYLAAASTFSRRSSATVVLGRPAGAQLGFHLRFSAMSFSAASRSPLRATISRDLRAAPP